MYVREADKDLVRQPFVFIIKYKVYQYKEIKIWCINNLVITIILSYENCQMVDEFNAGLATVVWNGRRNTKCHWVAEVIPTWRCLDILTWRLTSMVTIHIYRWLRDLWFTLVSDKTKMSSYKSSPGHGNATLWSTRWGPNGCGSGRSRPPPSWHESPLRPIRTVSAAPVTPGWARTFHVMSFTSNANKNSLTWTSE